jgi:hypothetical protein
LGSIVFHLAMAGGSGSGEEPPGSVSQAAQPARHFWQCTSLTGLPLISRLTQRASILPLTFIL